MLSKKILIDTCSESMLLLEKYSKLLKLVDKLLYDVSNQYEHSNSLDPYLSELRDFMTRLTK